MKNVELIFKTANERTSHVALALAEEHIQPSRTTILEKTGSPSASVQSMLDTRIQGDYIVVVDGDCLIGENIRPFLEFNEAPLVNAIVQDRFTGPSQGGFRIYQNDLLESMQQQAGKNGLGSRLHPEYTLCRSVRKAKGFAQISKKFFALLGYLQSWEDMFSQTALRSLQLIKQQQDGLLHDLMHPSHNQPVWHVVKAAARFANSMANRRNFLPDEYFFEQTLPSACRDYMEQSGLPLQRDLTLEEVGRVLEREQELLLPATSSPKIFGIGLGRTGTRSLNKALNLLGLDTIYFPHDPVTTREALNGEPPQRIMEFYAGITHLTAIPHVEALAEQWPNSKFILTFRPKSEWMKSIRHHWERPATETLMGQVEQKDLHDLQANLRARVYGCTEYNEEQLSEAYDLHMAKMTAYFEDKPGRFLVYDLLGGEAWDELCSFLGKEVPLFPFPHKGRRRSRTQEPSRPAPKRSFFKRKSR